MRYTLPFVVLALLAITSCKKEQQNINSDIPESTDSTVVVMPHDDAYFLSGLYNQEVTTLHRFSTEFILNRTATPEDRIVSVSVEDLPANTSGWFDVSSAEVPYKNNLHLYFMYAPPGEYPIKVITKSEGYAEKEYKFNIQVKEQSLVDCSKKFHNHFLSYPNIESSTTINGLVTGPFTEVIISSNNLFFNRLPLDNDANGYTQISFSNINNQHTLNGKDHVVFTFNCNNGTIVIPEQLVVGTTFNGNPLYNNFTVSGSGSVNPELGMYNITYTSTYLTGSGTKTTTYTLMGDFDY